jgi:hypothetical protein
LKADLSDFISVEMSLLRVFKHRFFSLMFENSGAKSASASLLLTLLFFKMDKVELKKKLNIKIQATDCDGTSNKSLDVRQKQRLS